MTYRFFVHDPDGDVEKVKTQQEAIDKANSLLEFYRENSADDGWDELAEQIFWGEIKQTAEMVNKEPAPEGSGFDYICDYALTDVPPEQSSVQEVARTIDNAPVGTLAPAIGGGRWYRTEHGWKWNGPDGYGGIFPRPGGDWTGKLIPPNPEGGAA